MLRPNKYSHPDRTVLNVAFLILSRIKTKRIDKYSDLLEYIKNSVKSGEFLFLPSLNFLYLLGLIEYRRKIDSIEYVGSNETI